MIRDEAWSFFALDGHVRPSEIYRSANSLVPPGSDRAWALEKHASFVSLWLVEIQMQRSAYTHRSHGTSKSKGSSIVPSGALLIAPDGEILDVGGPVGHSESRLKCSLVHTPSFRYLLAGDFDDVFGHQPSTNSLVMDSNDPSNLAAAPFVPTVFGTKRERLPDETVIRRSRGVVSHP